MRTTQLLPFALFGIAIAIPVQVQERDNGIIDKRTYVTKSEIVWTTTTVWSTELVWETDTPDLGAAGFEGNEEPKHVSTNHKHHKSHAIPTPAPYTPPVSTPAAPVPTIASSAAAPPPPPPSSAPSVAPVPTTTAVPPPPAPTSPSSAPVESAAPAPVESTTPAPVPSVSAPAPTPVAPAPAPAQSSSSSNSGSDSSGDSGNGSPSAPFVGQGTYYTPGMGSCGTTSTDADAIVAVGAGWMANGINPNNNPKCGQKITIQYKGVTKTATIVDTCEGCKTPLDLDMSPSLFDCFASESEGRLFGVKWWLNN